MRQIVGYVMVIPAEILATTEVKIALVRRNLMTEFYSRGLNCMKIK